MRLGDAMFMGVCVLLLAGKSIVKGDNAPDQSVPATWTNPGTEWLVRVKQYSRSWALGISDPQMAEEAQKPRVVYEFGMTIRVAGVEKSEDQVLARLEFIPLCDAPEKHVRGHRYTLTIDMHTLRAVEVECTRTEGVKLTPWTVQKGGGYDSCTIRAGIRFSSRLGNRA